MFISRVYTTLFRPEDYVYLLLEGIKKAIIYILKLTIILAVIITSSFFIFCSKEISKTYINFKDNCFDFEITDGKLSIDRENLNQNNEEYIKKLEKNNIYFFENDENIQNVINENNIESGIVLLKNDIYLIQKSNNYVTNIKSIGYTDIIDSIKEISNLNNLAGNGINKDTIINLEFSKKFLTIAIIAIGLYFFTIIFILLFILEMLGCLMISIIANFISILVNPKMKYDKIFSLTLYSSTLGYITLSLSIAIYLAFGIELKYMEILYYTLTLIYIIAVLYLIKHEFINELKNTATNKETLDNITNKIEQEKRNEQEKNDVAKKDREYEKNKNNDKSADEKTEKKGLKEKLKDKTSNKNDDLSSNNAIEQLERQNSEK